MGKHWILLILYFHIRKVGLTKVPSPKGRCEAGSTEHGAWCTDIRHCARCLFLLALLKCILFHCWSAPGFLWFPNTPCGNSLKVYQFTHLAKTVHSKLGTKAAFVLA